MNARIGSKLLYLSRSDVASAGITMPEIIAALERMFRDKAEQGVEMPPKIGIHPLPDAFIHAMPAVIITNRIAGLKWVGGYPGNGKRGLPYISGILVLNDFETGLPVALMDCSWITAQRTGAATAISAKYLARSDSRVVGVLGCGVEGRSNLEALTAVLPVEKVIAYDVKHDRAKQYVDKVRSQLHLESRVANDPKEAVADVDVVVTAGPILRTPHATIQKGWLKPGAFASLVDFDSYWHPAALHEADRFCTDDIPQFEHYRKIGYFQDVPPIDADLAELVTARKPGRRQRDERTIACNLGLALEDLAVAQLIYDQALERQLGTWLSL